MATKVEREATSEQRKAAINAVMAKVVTECDCKHCQWVIKTTLARWSDEQAREIDRGQELGE